MNESSFKKHHEDEHSRKVTKEVETSETHPSSEEVETSASANVRKSERKKRTQMRH